MANRSNDTLESLALQIFEITKITWLDAQRVKTIGPFDLSESEFLALDALEREDCLNVGELQRTIRVLPAQMSRIIKRLETGYESPLVTCSINPGDKRKIDVRLTDAGRAATDTFRRSKIDTTAAALGNLSAEDIAELGRITGILRQAMEQ